MSGAGNTLLVGIGNELRGDDGVGPYIVRELRAARPQQVEFLLLAADVTPLAEALAGVRAAYLFDASLCGAPAGTVRRFDALHEEFPRELFPCSTHEFPLADVVKLAAAVGSLPKKLVVFGIEAETVAIGQGLSAPVRAAAARVVSEVTSELARPRERAECVRATTGEMRKQHRKQRPLAGGA